jgi:predicted DNA-binding transcriptional regulator YafY
MMIQTLLRRALQNPDQWVVELDYVDSKGVSSRRVISPIRFLSSTRLLALCLCREEPRQFYLERCSNARLLDAAEVMMPVAMG